MARLALTCAVVVLAALATALAAWPDDSARAMPDIGGTPRLGRLGARDDHLSREAAVFYVSPAGSDTAGTGSQSSPWRTIKKACDTVPGGQRDTIRVAAGTYLETGMCRLRPGTNLLGAGAGSTVVKTTLTAGPLIRLQKAAASNNRQTISDMRLDGQSKSTAEIGIQAIHVRGLMITRMEVVDFKGTFEQGGGGIDVVGAWNLEISHSMLSNNGREWLSPAHCIGNLGVGDIVGGRIHDLRITDPKGLGVQASVLTFDGSSHLTNVEFYNLNIRIEAEQCANWNALGFELWQTDAVNVQIRNSRINRTLSLIDINNGSPLSNGTRYRIHHNYFDQPNDGGNHYAIELDNHSCEIDHNFFDSGLYAIAQFGRSMKIGNDIHHNVFDNQYGPTIALQSADGGGFTRTAFYANTVVSRQPASGLEAGVFYLSPWKRSRIALRHNLFVSPLYILGDKLGIGISLATIDRNGFYNIDARGSRAVVGDPELRLAGGFPWAYVPGKAPFRTSLGAFMDGVWRVGPDKRVGPAAPSAGERRPSVERSSKGRDNPVGSPVRSQGTNSLLGPRTHLDKVVRVGRKRAVDGGSHR